MRVIKEDEGSENPRLIILKNREAVVFSLVYASLMTQNGDGLRLLILIS